MAGMKLCVAVLLLVELARAAIREHDLERNIVGAVAKSVADAILAAWEAGYAEAHGRPPGILEESAR